MGLASGFGLATVFSAYVVVTAAFGGRAHAELGLSVPSIIAFYYMGGVVSGLVYGAVAPVATWWLGRAFVGFVIVLPIGVGMIAILPEAGLGDRGAWLDALLFACLVGGLGGPHFLDPDAKGR